MDESKKMDLGARLEAILFLYGEPLSIKKIALLLELSPSDTETLIGEYGRNAESKQRGLTVLRNGDSIQLITKPEFGSLLEKMMKAEVRGELTPAALETLAIIGYAGPITRAEVDYIRGVNSSFIIRNLALRGLIERVTDEKRGNSFLYSASNELLKFLGLGNITNLPEYEKFRSVVQAMRATSAPQGGSGDAVVTQTNRNTIMDIQPNPSTP